MSVDLRVELGSTSLHLVNHGGEVRVNASDESRRVDISIVFDGNNDRAVALEQDSHGGGILSAAVKDRQNAPLGTLANHLFDQVGSDVENGEDEAGFPVERPTIDRYGGHLGHGLLRSNQTSPASTPERVS